jgi:hypothetical protein
MALFAIAIPLPTEEQKNRWLQFIGDLQGERREDFVASRRALGVRERVFLQETPHGALVLVTLEGDDPAAAFGQFGKSGSEFDDWFAQQVLAIHDFDLKNPPDGPMPRLVNDSGPMENGAAG